MPHGGRIMRGVRRLFLFSIKVSAVDAVIKYLWLCDGMFEMLLRETG